MRHGYVMGSLASTNTLYRPPDTPMWMGFDNIGGIVTSTNNFSSITRSAGNAAYRYIRLAVHPNGTIVGYNTLNFGSTMPGGKLVYSSDFGKTWNDATSQSTGVIASGDLSTAPQVRWYPQFNGFIVNTGSNSGCSFSSDGKNWTRLDLLATSDLDASADRIITVGLTVTIYRIMVRSGSSWTVTGRSLPFITSAVAYSPNIDRWIISRKEAEPNTNPNMAYSDDGGENWTTFRSNVFVGNASTMQNLMFWSKTQNRFIMFANNSTSLMHSTDGITWKLSTSNTGSSSYPRSYYENQNTLMVWTTGSPVKYTGNMVPTTINLSYTGQNGFYWDPTGALYT